MDEINIELSEAYTEGFMTGFKAGELKCAAFMEANKQLVEENERLKSELLHRDINALPLNEAYEQLKKISDGTDKH